LNQYARHDFVVQATQCARVCTGRRKIPLSTVFAGQFVGVREVADEVCRVTFMDQDLGFFDRFDDSTEQ
jgi:hypothetical protein